MKIFIDANVFAYALLSEESSGEKAKALLDEIARGKYEGVTSALVMDEIMWVLIKNQKTHLVEQYIKNIYEQPHLTVMGVDANTPIVALSFMKKYGLKPRDAMHCAFMQLEGINTIATDDKDFDKIPQVKRLSR